MTDQSSSEGLTIKDSVLQAKEWFTYVLSKWKVLLIFGLLGGGVGIAMSFLDKMIYTAELTFALDEKGSSSAYAGIASQFGIELGGAGGGAFEGENILELLRSRNIIEKTLLTPVNIEGKRQLLINRYIDFNEYREKWAKSRPDMASVVFTENEDRDQFGVKKDSLLATIFKVIKKKQLIVERIDKKMGIIRVKVMSEDEQFAKYFAEELLKAASDLYVQSKTTKSKNNVSILESRLDSVKRELDANIYGAASTKDQNQNVIRARGNITFSKKQLNVQVLTTMYGELIKNTELAKYTLMREEPLLQVIDKPYFPLDRKKLGKAKGGLYGGILGGFVGLGFILFLKFKSMYLDGIL